MMRGNVTYRILTDHLGSVRLVVAVDGPAAGTIAQRIDYDEFGIAAEVSGAGFQPFGFAGGMFDRDTRLVRFGARDYDPETARWTANDTLRFRGGGTNLFGNANADPNTFTDAEGLTPLHNGYKFPITFKRETGDSFAMCAPYQSCDVDGFFTPDCSKLIKLVGGCIGEVTPDGVVHVECPFFLPEEPWLRKFPNIGQRALGGPVDAAFLKRHSDWQLPPGQASHCQCE